MISETGIADMNDVTSTKQPVSGATGLVVMANNSNDFVNTYWHAVRSLGASAPAAIAGDLAAAPTTGDAPLTVQFADRSSGGPAELVVGLRRRRRRRRRATRSTRTRPRGRTPSG